MTRVVLPGDLVYSLSSKKVVGAGLRKDGEDVYTVVPGVFHETDDKALISTLTKRLLWFALFTFEILFIEEFYISRYIPRAGDRVLGVVVAKIGDYFRIDIGSADLALLNFVSFEGATKRNRPMVKVGDLVYGQVILTSKHLEPEVYLLVELHKYFMHFWMSFNHKNFNLFCQFFMHFFKNCLM